MRSIAAPQEDTQENEAEFEIENNLGVPLLFWEANEPIEITEKTTDTQLANKRNVFSLNAGE